MSRDYKQASDRPSNKKRGSPFLTGLLLGILLGVGASLAVVMYLKSDDNPFAIKSTKETNQSLADKIASDAKTQNTPAEVVTPPVVPDTNNPPAEADNKDDTRFDYYDILPNNSNNANDSINIKPDEPQAPKKTYYLQIGSFQTEEEADNLKAKLALQGFEAAVQTAIIPDKGTWHRVRVGPFNNLDNISATKEALISNGFSADLIKVNN